MLTLILCELLVCLLCVLRSVQAKGQLVQLKAQSEEVSAQLVWTEQRYTKLTELYSEKMDEVRTLLMHLPQRSAACVQQRSRASLSVVRDLL
jgi:hypothetical protein